MCSINADELANMDIVLINDVISVETLLNLKTSCIQSTAKAEKPARVSWWECPACESNSRIDTAAKTCKCEDLQGTS